jgi:ketosteroid isomerase-like protein
MYDDVIRQMFKNIDKSEWIELAHCFHPDITYERPGLEPLVGRDRVMHFYLAERVVASGRHTVEGTLADDTSGAAWGRMVGTLKDGSSVTIRFAEIYQFCAGVICGRTSYFFTPTV